MTNTSRLGLPVIDAAQAQKHVTYNEALILLDALTQLAVENRTLTTPPGTPADGACYIPAVGATGAWAGGAGRSRFQRWRLDSHCPCVGAQGMGQSRTADDHL